MINSNIDRNQSVVKGAMGNYVGAKYKYGHTPHEGNYHGYKVNSAMSDDICYLVITIEN